MARVVLITGGTTGIGAKTALMFKENGYQVVCNYIGNKEKAQSFSAKSIASHATIIIYSPL